MRKQFLSEIAKRRAAQTALALAAVAVLALLVGAARLNRDVMRKNTLLEKARVDLRGQDGGGRDEIRRLDAEYRQAQLRREIFVRKGALACALLVCLFFLCNIFLQARTLPEVRKPGEKPISAALARPALAGVSGFALVMAFAFILTHGKVPAEKFTPPLQPDKPAPGAEDFRRNWARFRGREGAGIAVGEPYPTSWNAATGTGIIWKKELSLPGASSPIIWNELVFLTAADKDSRLVYCFSAKDGAAQWERRILVPGGTAEAPNVWDEDVYAAATPATDGEKLFVAFATGDLACLDFSGNVLWAKKLSPRELPDNNYGHSSSPVVVADKLIIQFDQGSLASDGKSFLLALDKNTGNIIWKTPRAVPNSWSTPISAIHAGREIIVTTADPLVQAYDAGDGRELWSANLLGGEHTASPVYADGRVYAATESMRLACLDAGGAGDITQSGLKWEAFDGLPNIASPLCYNGLIFLADSGGKVTCYDAASGEKLWEQECGTPFQSSPVGAGGKVYCFDEKGTAHIFSAGKTLAPVGTAEISEPVKSSPALVAGRIFVRTKKHLFCIGTGNDG
jgi:outer membrane protein assembly factor BamB